MKVILSRKGFDSESGRIPSPILPDGRLISIPVPEDERRSALRYTAVYYEPKRKLVGLMEELGKKSYLYRERARSFNKGRVHLDPDLRECALKRESGWTHLFGQSGNAQTILKENGVGNGDLFLFFGSFKKTKLQGNRFIYDRDEKEKHVIFGYLQIDSIKNVNKDSLPEWMHYFSHVHFKNKKGWENNTIYVARKFLDFAPRIPGGGTFQLNEAREQDRRTKLTLTKPECSKSKWDLPFKKCKVSWHAYSSLAKDPWLKDYFQSPGRGQELVFEERDDITEWANNLGSVERRQRTRISLGHSRRWLNSWVLENPLRSVRYEKEGLLFPVERF